MLESDLSQLRSYSTRDFSVEKTMSKLSVEHVP